MARAGRAGGRLLPDVAPVLAFTVVGLTAAMVRFSADGTVRDVAVAYVSGMVIILLARAASVFLLAPHAAAIHTVPFGELCTVTNYNRDWVIYKMEFRLPIDTDMEQVRKIIKKIGQELMEDPEHGQNLLQPLKSQGIHRIEETAIILRTKFMCKPKQQFVLRRVAYLRIQQAFEDAGIKLAPRVVRVAAVAIEQANVTA